MKDIKQIEDELLDEVSGGGPMYDHSSKLFLIGVFKMFLTLHEKNLNLKGLITSEIYDKLDPVEQVNFLNVLNEYLSGDTLTDDRRQELLKELERIMSTIKTN